MSNNYEKKENILQEKAFLFALKTISLCKYLQREHKEFVISNQLYRSATSVGANIAEANFSESRADFKHKMNVSLKESNESEYWLRLISESGYAYGELDEIQSLCLDIKYLLIASISTTVKNKKQSTLK